MLSEKPFEFTKDVIDQYLREVAKEYRKQAGKKMPAELILIGGASVLINYRYGLPYGWLNADFMNTGSYSDKLSQFSVYYKTYSNTVTIRTINAEYLIAMKLRSGRQYKNDLSDVLGILSEHEKRGTPITMEQIRKAVTNLYGSWNTLPESSREFIENAMKNGHFKTLYDQTVSNEKETKAHLIKFETQYPGILKNDNVEQITKKLQKKAEQESILAEIQKRKSTEK